MIDRLQSQVTTRFIPSLILGEIYPRLIRHRFDIANVIQVISGEGYFKRCELPATLDAEEERAIGEFNAVNTVSLSCWASELLAEENLNLSAINESERIHAVSRVQKLADRVANWGSDSLGLLSGPDPGVNQRETARRQLVKSLVELGRFSEKDAMFRVVLEPLDRGVHKNGLIGPTQEALDVVRRVREQTEMVFMGWDSGHAVLNDEDPVESLKLAAAVCSQLHLSNPVTDRASPLCGDHHYPIGTFGLGSAEQFQGIVRAAMGLPLAMKEETSIAIEVRTQGTHTPQETIQHCEAVLRNVLGVTIVAQ